MHPWGCNNLCPTFNSVFILIDVFVLLIMCYVLLSDHDLVSALWEVLETRYHKGELKIEFHGPSIVIGNSHLNT